MQLTDEQILAIAVDAEPPFPWGIGSTRLTFLRAVHAVLAAHSAGAQGLTIEQIEKAALDFVKKPGMQGYVEPGDLIDFARALLANGE